MAAETGRENLRRERVAKDRAEFIEGPVLILPVGRTFYHYFDPNQVVPLDDLHAVYLDARVTDDWGTLEAPEESSSYGKVDALCASRCRGPPTPRLGLSREMAGRWSPKRAGASRRAAARAITP
jgi:hypothetical protein